MNKSYFTAVALAGALFAAAAPAATITQNGVTTLTNSANLSIGDDITFNEQLSAVDGQSLYSFAFTALEKLKVSFIAMTATSSQAMEIAKVRYGYSNPPTETFSVPVILPGGTGLATGELPSFVLLNGQTMHVFFEEADALARSVGTSSSFSVSKVPVPAALPLLAGAIAALGLARRKPRQA